MDVMLPNGKEITGVPEGTPKDVIMQKAIAAGLATASDFGAQPPDQEVDPQAQLDAMNDSQAGSAETASTGIGAADAGLEFAAAFNRGATKLADFLTTDQINAVSQVLGSEFRVPSITDTLSAGTSGGFMPEGMARDVVRSAGEVAPSALSGALAARGLAGGLPQFSAQTEGVIPGIVRQAGQETARSAVATGALAGAGSELGKKGGGEVGEALGGESGRESGEAIGSLVGGIALPIGASAVKELASSLTTKGAKALLRDAAPTVDGLKSTARGVYKEIDDLGATVNSGRIAGLGGELRSSVRKEGFNKTIHPKVQAALKEFELAGATNKTLSEVDTLRKVAGAAAGSIDPDEARLGKLMVDKVDDFLDGLKSADFVGGQNADVGAKYRDARQLWGRAKRSEMLEQAFEKAKNQASGFENGIRVQFRSLLNNPKKMRGFSNDEKDAIRRVVRGDTAENIAKMLGRFGMSEGQASNMLMGSLGVAGGAAVGGPAGAVAVPVIGQVSRGLAQKMTRNNSEMANALVRAGKDGKKLINAYMTATSKADRSIDDLTEILLRGSIPPQVKLSGKPTDEQKLIADSIYFATLINQKNESEK